MKAIASGVAHLSFAGGGLFLPARSPYDRQTLAEHIASRARRNGQVQVLVDDRRWLVYRRSAASAAVCTHCGASSLASACYAIGCAPAAYCVRCAFLEPLPLPNEAQRRAG